MKKTVFKVTPNRKLIKPYILTGSVVSGVMLLFFGTWGAGCSVFRNGTRNESQNQTTRKMSSRSTASQGDSSLCSVQWYKKVCEERVRNEGAPLQGVYRYSTLEAAYQKWLYQQLKRFLEKQPPIVQLVNRAKIKWKIWINPQQPIPLDYANRVIDTNQIDESTLDFVATFQNWYFEFLLQIEEELAANFLRADFTEAQDLLEKVLSVGKIPLAIN